MMPFNPAWTRARLAALVLLAIAAIGCEEFDGLFDPDAGLDGGFDDASTGLDSGGGTSSDAGGSTNGRPASVSTPAGYPDIVFRNDIRCSVSNVTGGSAVDAATLALIEANTLAACDMWGAFVSGSGSLEISLNFIETPTNRASGASRTSAFFETINGISIYEQAAAAEVRTGQDPNGAEADIDINIDPDHIDNLWFDPDPYRRTATVPSGQTDAMSTLLHELGHAFAFNGWLSNDTGQSTIGGDMSTFDRHVHYEGGRFTFHGPQAVAEFGGELILAQTNNTYVHLGNTEADDPRLVQDLMNGVFFTRGQRYYISDLDLAVVRDSGLPTR